MSTLFKFGFSKKINHPKTTVNIGRVQPHFTNGEAGRLNCDECCKKFKSKQGLIGYFLWAHKELTAERSAAGLFKYV